MKVFFYLICLFYFGSNVIAQNGPIIRDTIRLKLSSYNSFVYENQSYTACIKDENIIDKLFDVISIRNRELQSGKIFHEVGIPFMIFTNLKKGHYEIPSNIFEYNGNVYLTNKLVFEVVDSFRLVHKSLNIMALSTSDSTLCIMINQNIPVDSTGMYDEFRRMKKGFEMQKEAVALNSNSKLVSSLSHLSSSSSSKVLELRDSNSVLYTYSSTTTINLWKPKEFLARHLSESDFINIPLDFKFDSIPIR